MICPPEPIGLNQNAFDTWRKGEYSDDPTDTLYSDKDYRSGRPQRRFFLHTDPSSPDPNATDSFNTPGQFAWLRWTKNDTSVQTLADALKPPGTLDQGFQEVDPWDKELNVPPTDPYPTQKGVLNAFDLVYGAPTMKLGAGYNQNGPTAFGGDGGDTAVATQLQWLIKNHVAFNVAEFDAYNKGIGTSAVYRVTGFKSYMLVGYGFEPNNPSSPHASRGYGWFLDLVQLGKPLECAQNENQAEIPPDQKVTLAGTVNVRAVYGDDVSGRPPLDMVIVLDASGSMNWTWEGIGSVSSSMNPDLNPYVNGKVAIGKDVKCSAALSVPVGCQSSEAYKDYTKRKIYQAKQTLKNFMETFNWQSEDRVAIVTYSGGSNSGSIDNAILSLTKVYPAEGLTTDIDTLAVTMINQAGKGEGLNITGDAAHYTTVGASPGALGLQSLPKNYKPGGKTDDYPTNQAIAQANLITEDTSSKKAKIYVIALGSTFNKAGLDQMASDRVPPYLVSANSDSQLQQQLEDIGNQIVNGPCDPQLEPDRPPDVDRTMRYTASGFVSEKDSEGQGSGGKIVLKQNGARVGEPINIAADGTFRIPNLSPNSDYTLTFNNAADGQDVWYLGKDTPKQQLRKYDTVYDTGSQELPVHIQDASISATQFVHPDNSPIVLELTGAGVCPPTKP